MTCRFPAARRTAGRLAIVVLLAVLVSGVTYAVAYSPVATSVVGVRGGPPGGRPDLRSAGEPGQPTQAGQRAGSVAPGTVGQSSLLEQIPSGNQVSAAGAPTTSLNQTPPVRRPEGGGRGPSLVRGLPELGRYAAVIGVLMIAVTLGRGMLRLRRKRAALVLHA